MRIISVICMLILSFGSAAYALEKLPVTIYTTSGEMRFDAEMATTTKTRSRGLQNRSSLEDSDGMLFVFPVATNSGFWMKDTLIALDMIFIDENYTIVHIEHNARPHTLEPRTAGQPYIAVLEIKGGEAKRLGILREDRVRFTLPAHVEVN